MAAAHMTGEAQMLLDNLLLAQIFDRLEKDCTESAIYAVDDEKRRNLMNEVRAIRSVRAKLQAIVKAETTPPDVDAVA